MLGRALSGLTVLLSITVAPGVYPATLAAIDAGVKEGQAEIDALAAKTFGINGLFGSRAQLNTNYLQRDVGAMKDAATI